MKKSRDFKTSGGRGCYINKMGRINPLRGCGGETPIYKIEILFPKKVMSTPFAIKRKTENDSSSSTLR